MSKHEWIDAEKHLFGKAHTDYDFGLNFHMLVVAFSSIIMKHNAYPKFVGQQSEQSRQAAAVPAHRARLAGQAHQ